jgi:hypothetical protein
LLAIGSPFDEEIPYHKTELTFTQAHYLDFLGLLSSANFSKTFLSTLLGQAPTYLSIQEPVEITWGV